MLRPPPLRAHGTDPPRASFRPSSARCYSYFRNAKMQDKLIARILIVWLQLDGYAVVVETASAALKLPPSKCTTYLREVGCNIGSRVVEGGSRKRAVGVLEAPLVFPKLKSGAQRR